MTITPLGRTMRTIRLDRGERLLDWAERLGIGSAELSGIEFGKRPLPDGFVETVIVKCGLRGEQADFLRGEGKSV